MSDDPTQYLPEQFRVSAEPQHESADLAESLSRLVGRVAPAAGQFGGAGAAGFAAALGRTADERGQAAQRATEDRGEGTTRAAALGEETDELAATAVGRVQLDDEARRIADGV